MKRIFYLFMLVIAFSGCSTETVETEENFMTADAKANKEANTNAPVQLGEPSILCGEATAESWPVIIKAGTNGTPGGIKIEWMTMEDYNNNGDQWIEELSCGSKFETVLAEAEETTIDLADFIGNEDKECYMEWDCEEVYVFRVKAENLPGNDYRSSAWSMDYTCQAQTCEEQCLYGYGYWKTHGINPPGMQSYMWPIDQDEELMVGNEYLDIYQIYDALMANPQGGDEIVTLIHHLISAKFNTIMTGDDSAIATMIEQGDLMVVNPENYSKGEINAVKDELEAYNESAPCEEED